MTKRQSKEWLKAPSKKGVQKETWYLKEKIEELERRIQELEEKNK